MLYLLALRENMVHLFHDSGKTSANKNEEEAKTERNKQINKQEMRLY